MNIKTLFLTITLLITSHLVTVSQNKIEIDSKAASELIQKDKSIVILDVRTPLEYKNGHLKNALNYDIKDSIAFSKIVLLDHNQKYLVHCRTNHRSGKAVEFLIKQGFKNIYQLSDGYTGWEANKLEIEK